MLSFNPPPSSRRFILRVLCASVPALSRTKQNSIRLFRSYRFEWLLSDALFGLTVTHFDGSFYPGKTFEFPRFKIQDSRFKIQASLNNHSQGRIKWLILFYVWRVKSRQYHPHSNSSSSKHLH
ncbi:unnamed protein product, partial [Scytosiphon promiscuus]